MDRLSKKIDNAKNFDDDKEGVILSEVELTNDILVSGEVIKETNEKIDLLTEELKKKDLEFVLNDAILKKIKGDRGDRGLNGKDGLDGSDGIDGEDGKNGKDGKDGKGLNGKDGYTPIKGIDYFTKEEIEKIKKATALKKNYFNKKIAKLKLELAIIKKRDYYRFKATERPFGGGAGSQGQTDLSSQCNGILKVFILNDSYRPGTVKLHSSQAPLIFRPIVDFTESADKQITLTSEVGAPQTGQTLMAFYEKP